jgi:simple sugar transport system ATP-binding protein
VTDPVLSLRGIRKSYGRVEAVRGVDLDVYAGEVLALCGDNGAGKSTLVKIIAGALEPSGGVLCRAGTQVAFRAPSDALRAGIATIYQDLALAPRLSITQNIFLGSELTRGLLLDKAAMAGQARGFLERLHLPFPDLSVPVDSLSGGQRQAVALARALRWQAALVIMDEPTAALGVRETAEVLGLIRRLRDEGRSVLLISHNMEDVCAVANRVAILKNGIKAIDRETVDLTADRLAHMVMTGRESGTAAT